MQEFARPKPTSTPRTEIVTLNVVIDQRSPDKLPLDTVWYNSQVAPPKITVGGVNAQWQDEGSSKSFYQEFEIGEADTMDIEVGMQGRYRWIRDSGEIETIHPVEETIHIVFS